MWFVSFHEVRIFHGNEWEGKCNLSCHMHSGRRSDTGFALGANEKIRPSMWRLDSLEILLNERTALAGVG